MFGTFSLPTGSNNEASDHSSAPSKPRSKRQQVNRACAWCRTYRIKCDAHQPCGNCKARGRKCTSEQGNSHVRTFPSAIKEIDRLQARVKALEDQVKNLQLQETSRVAVLGDTKLTTKKDDTLPEELDPLSQHGGNKAYYNWDFAIREIKPGSNQTYGLSSNYYFTDQLAKYLKTSLLQKHYGSFDNDEDSVSLSVNSIYTALAPSDTTSLDRTIVGHDLLRSEEEELLQLYWGSWHIHYPIIDRESFDLHYSALWKSADSRIASALVDILLALCLQFDAALQVAHSTGTVDAVDTTAGWWAYRRCTHFLQDELEEPTIRTFQCHFLAALWLGKANWHNAAHNMLAAALRIGVILGLHTEPCPNLHPKLRDYRKRMWWVVYAMDAHYAMEMGRPLGVPFGQVNCSLPKLTSDFDIANSGPAGYSDQMIRLVLATRAIYVMFYRVCAKVLRQIGCSSLNKDPRALEYCAEWLSENMSYLRSWLKQVPHALKTDTNKFGELRITSDLFEPENSDPHDDYSRSRTMLELIYHQMVMSLYRPFIVFRDQEESFVPFTDRHAAACANHAITIVNIISQDLHGAGSLKSWQTVCCWQWNAALVLVGYILAHPQGISTANARKTLDSAMLNYAILSHIFVVARNAAETLADILRKVDSLRPADVLERHHRLQEHASEILSEETSQAKLPTVITDTFVSQDGCSGLDTSVDWLNSEIFTFGSATADQFHEDWANLLDFGPS